MKTFNTAISYYSVDIDLINGEQIRDKKLEFKNPLKAEKLYNKIKSFGKFNNVKIDNIQIVINYKNGNYCPYSIN